MNRLKDRNVFTDVCSRHNTKTAYLVQGLLTARQYFDGAHADEAAIRDLATQIWEGVDWDAYRPASPGDVLYWHWSPTRGFTGSIPASIYHIGWARGGAIVNGNTYLGYRLPVGPAWGGPLFFAHYSFLGLDPRFHRDAYANYFDQNRSHSLIHWAYCRDYLIDWEHGGWYSGGLDKDPERKTADKAGIWKGPYHTARSLMNCISNLEKE